MDDFFKKLLSIAGYLFAGLLIVFTSMQTYALLFEVSGSQVTAAIGMILFEASMLYWWMVFRREAEGLLQMAIAGLMFVVGLLLVTVAVALHLGAIEVAILGPHTPARIVIIAALLNLTAKLVYPLVHPDTYDTITDRAQTGKVVAKAQKLFETKIDGIANDLADDMAELRKEQARTAIFEKFTTDLNRRQAKTLPQQPHQVDVIPLMRPNGKGPTIHE